MENNTFNYELAEKIIKSILEGKAEEAQFIIDSKGPAKEAAEARLRNINMLLEDSNSDLLKKLIDLVLLEDVFLIIRCYNTAKEKVQTQNNGLISACIDCGIRIGRTYIMYGQETLTGYNSEELRQFLYSKLGFIYQTREEALAMQNENSEVLDPLALPTLYKSKTLYNMLDNIDLIRESMGPQHVTATKTK